MAQQKRFSSVRAYLEATGRTQSSLADEIGISYPVMSRIVRGLQSPKPRLAIRISEVTGVSIESLVRASVEAA